MACLVDTAERWRGITRKHRRKPAREKTVPRRAEGTVNNLFEIRAIKPGIMMCRVCIPVFMERYLPHVPVGGYERKKNLEFGEGILDGRIFSPSEISWVNGFRTLKKQVEWLSGRFAVKMLVHGFEKLREPLSSVTVSYGESGAPLLDRFSELSISISHSHEYAIAALLSGKGRRIGLDLERVEEKDPEYIIHVAFTRREEEAIDRKDYLGFYTLWTAKEAYMKYIGKGFNESLKRVEILNGRVLHNDRPVTDIEFVTGDFDGRYAYTLIYDS